MAEIKQISAIARGVTLAPRKVSLVAALIRGRSLADALVILDHTPKRAALPLKKVISSAGANATHSLGLQNDSLMIKSLQVTTGPRLKRFRPAARGRALPYEKKTSHIHVVVSGSVKPKKTASSTTKTTKSPAKKSEKEGK